MSLASTSDPSICYFIDDNRRNVEAARELGWGHCVHFCERGLEHVEGGKVQKISNASHVNGVGQNDMDIKVISELGELRDTWPEIFKSN